MVGNLITNNNGDPILLKYERFVPKISDVHTLYAISFIVGGIACIWSIERFAMYYAMRKLKRTLK